DQHGVGGGRLRELERAAAACGMRVVRVRRRFVRDPDLCAVDGHGRDYASTARRRRRSREPNSQNESAVRKRMIPSRITAAAKPWPVCWNWNSRSQMNQTMVEVA